MTLTILFVIIAVFFLLIMIIIIRRKRIKVAIYHLLYGTFSYKYLSLYKQYTGKSPFPYCFKDDFLNHIFYMLKVQGESPVYKTDAKIKFGDEEFLVDRKHIMQKRGEPDFFQSHEFNDHIFKVAGYWETIFNSEVKMLFFFIDDIFFMGEYLFREKSLAHLDEIVPILESKYMREKIGSRENFYLMDEDQSMIFLGNNGFNVFIQYKKYVPEIEAAFLEIQKKQLTGNISWRGAQKADNKQRF
ncbi:MAG: hypothetical protein FJY10_08425 [Bacteroidetes bacterium]|nr:hypothetical protein [Bacteroidota bacterium]